MKNKAFIAILALGALFVDDYSSVKNRLILRYNNAQLQEAIYTLNHLQKPIH
jgi:hypothetical protein